jgi:hypothetical protein
VTIEREADGVFFVCCDTCGDTETLEGPEDSELRDAHSTLRQKGWRVSRPDKVEYGLGPKYKIEYYTHTCRDCQP